MSPVLDASIQEPFSAAEVGGTTAIYDTADGIVRCGDLERCAKGYVPASTFKIANTAIALENGVIASAESPLRWDGQPHEVQAWNQDHTVRSAFRASCVPCYQQVAREIGEARMQDWLARLEYGNQDCSGSVDFFWLGGNLHITPLEQLDFLWRLDTGALPLRPETVEVIKEIMEADTSLRGGVLRGKTGWAQPPDVPEEIAWFVGWYELGKRRIYFATVIDAHPAEQDIGPLRQELTESVLSRFDGSATAVTNTPLQ